MERETGHTYQDQRGRPLIAVTGMGIVTSLGCGKSDNWSKLSRGRSGIRQITRFPTEGLRTTIAGTVDGEIFASPSAAVRTRKLAVVAAAEALDEAGLNTSHFPGPLFLATPPAEIEWPQRVRLYASFPNSKAVGYGRLIAAARMGSFGDIAEDARFSSAAEELAERFGTTGLPYSVSTACASGGTAI